MNDYKAKILIVDDEPDILELLKDLFEKKGFAVSTAENARKAMKHIQREIYNIVLTDLKMPEIDGIELLTKIKEFSSDTEVIVITGHGSIESAVDAIKKGAYDYIIKPIKMDDVLFALDRILHLQSLTAQNRYLKNKLSSPYKFDNIIGKNAKMNKVFDIIKDVAFAQTTVLIRGESGTGKELIAHAIHYNSSRADRPMIGVNCAVLSENLLESELFGHVKGAFTGAIRDKEGRFEMANGGTLFLDEIGDISPNLQVKLLRVLQEGEFEKVGGEKTVKVDVRIIAATNKNLEQAIEKGEFRTDLYYRLNVIPIEVPPLRERLDDIPLLVEYFINKFNQEIGKNVIGLTNDAMKILMSYHWPGNVRELENAIERAVVLSKGHYIGEQALSYLVASQEVLTPMQRLENKTLPEVIDEFEKELLINMLAESYGNKSVAARKLGIHRSTLLSKLSKFDLE